MFMSDIDGAAAPADTSSTAPSPADQGTPKPNPASVDNRDPAPKKAPTAREALEKAAKTVDKQAPAEKPVASKTPAKEPAAKAPAKAADGKEAPEAPKTKATVKEAVAKAAAPKEGTEAKEPAPRGDHGHFAPKTAAEEREASTQDTDKTVGDKPDDIKAMPKRFRPEAQADWDSTPDTVKGEVHRAHRELEQGLQKYRERAERDAQIDQYHENSRQNGTTVKESLDRYVNIETLWDQNPVNGFLAVCANKGVDPLPIAKMVYEVIEGATQRGEIPTGEKFVQQSREQDLAHREQRLQKQAVDIAAGEEVRNFINDENREAFEERAPAIAAIIRFTQVADLDQAFQLAERLPRYEEVADRVEKMLKTGYASNLKQAYDEAIQLIPGGAPPASQAPGASSAPADAPRAQTPKGTRSIAGAPSAGSDPDQIARPPSKSVRDSLRRAVDRVAG